MPEHDCPRPTTATWRRCTASGAVAGAMALGVRSALDDGRAGEAVVVEAGGEAGGPPTALELHFDARGPAETWAVARPWMLRG